MSIHASPEAITPSDALWDAIKRQMREAAEKRLDPVRVAARNAAMTVKERALKDAGAPLSQTAWER